MESEMPDAFLGRELIAVLKNTAGMPGPVVVIPVGLPPMAFLRPVAVRQELLKPNDIQVLTAWRNRFVGAFLTEFQATEERTARWLVDQVGPNDGKILFMVDDVDGRTIGYMGLDRIDWAQGSGEVDAIVRGRDAAPGLMLRCLQALIQWAKGQLGLRTIGVRVRSDNRALDFYRKVGFQEVHRTPLRAVEEPGMKRWVEDGAFKEAELHLIHMLWRSENP
jgi:RimJ/RimL family protein N-acetyltransferase